MLALPYKGVFAFSLFLIVNMAFAENRFGRPVVKVRDANEYQFTKNDDVKYPTLSNERFTVSCLVYRGTERYYVEAVVTNKTSLPISMLPNFISFDKPGYTIYRTDTMIAAQEAAASGGIRFTPTSAPYVPPTYRTIVNASANSYGDQTYVYGTATTTADTSGQAGANIGNAIGNAIAAHSFYKAQRIEVAFSHFLADHTQTDLDTALKPGQSRAIVATFEQSKQKKKPFDIILKVGDDTFRFLYKE